MKEPRYLVENDFMADPAVHVFEGKLYIYPSHDRESGIPENDNGDHFDMNDYHVFSTSDIENEPLTDHGVVLKVSDIPCTKASIISPIPPATPICCATPLAIALTGLLLTRV